MISILLCLGGVLANVVMLVINMCTGHFGDLWVSGIGIIFCLFCLLLCIAADTGR
jgi:hypothetical protein